MKMTKVELTDKLEKFKELAQEIQTDLDNSDQTKAGDEFDSIYQVIRNTKFALK